MNKSYLNSIGLVALLLSSCSYDDFVDTNRNADNFGKINLSGSIDQEYNTRANDDGFVDGDDIGVYIVDYEGGIPGILQSKGNRGDNVRHTFNESSFSWSSAYDLYWKDKNTAIDVYGYYPFGSPDDVNHYTFSIKTNQTKTYDNGDMGDYEASDFLWGKVAGVEPTTSVIKLPFAHKMASARVTLVEGGGFATGEWADLKKQVLVTNTIQECEIDLSSGKTTPKGEVSQTPIIPTQRNDEWRAIVVPQNIPGGTVIFSITIDGVPYTFHKNETFEYIGGKMNNFIIRVDKKELTGKYTLTLISESITPWENDLVSHDAKSKEYIVVNSTAGGLKNAIIAAGKDYAKVQNLKVTGIIDVRDFEFMRDEMEILSSLNIKEVKITKRTVYPAGEEDAIPDGAFNNKVSLNRMILPDKLKSIGASAFGHCNLVGSLEVPNGVVEIGSYAFVECKALTGSITLPSSLKRIGNWAFANCNFTGELKLPNALEDIGEYVFQGCQYLSGELMLPENLQKLGSASFSGCQNLHGNLKIPQKITKIQANAFNGCKFGGTLILHNGITEIGAGAFTRCDFRGELNLPKSLTAISEYAFEENNFSGTLVLPQDLKIIGYFAFGQNPLISGILEFPEGMTSIDNNAFYNCAGIQGLIFPESMEFIGANVFWDCFGVGSIVCKGTVPPYIAPSTFKGVPKDNFTLEVPESALTQYQTTAGWNEFKRIAAHHELVCRPQTACALNKEKRQALVLNAEGDWEVVSKPDWCTLSQMSGSKKTELTLTIKEYSQNYGFREGDIVFRLKDKDYRHSCHVSQYGYQYKEDEYIALQKATKGNNGGINIIILGDGYDAKDISSGDYLRDMNEQIEYFFGIEPYTTYRDYFNVYTAFPMSTESGVGTVNTIKYSRFNTIVGEYGECFCDFQELTNYVMAAPNIDNNLGETLVIMIPNGINYGHETHLWENGYAISFCPINEYSYPYDSRGIVQHEAGGHGFGKLGDENMKYNYFYQDIRDFNEKRSYGWWKNVDIVGKMHDVPWSHLIFDPRYSDIVDIFEGGLGYSRGVFRSEHTSCMNNCIPYYNTISRELIVRRIKQYAGEGFDFEEFVANDKKGAAQARIHKTRGGTNSAAISTHSTNMPVFHKGSPLKSTSNNKKSKKR